MSPELDGIVARLNDMLADVTAIRQGLDRTLPAGLVQEIGPIALSGRPQPVQPQNPFRYVRITAGAYAVSLGLSRRSAMDAPLATVDAGLSALVSVGLQTRVWISGTEGDTVQLWTSDAPIGAGLTGQALGVSLIGSLPAGTNSIGNVRITDSFGNGFQNAGASYGFAPAVLGDANANATQDAVPAVTEALAFNESTWDRVRNNTQGVLLPSAARTANTQSPLMTNYNSRGVLVFLNVTAVSGTGGLILKVWGSDPASGAVVNLLQASSAITTISLFGYMVYPGASISNTGGNNVVQSSSAALPRIWSVAVFTGDASPYTYSVGYALIN